MDIHSICEPNGTPNRVVMRNNISKQARLKRKRSSLILEPLFAQVTSFVRDAARKQPRKKKRSKKSETLLTEIHNALQKLIRVGRGIAFDYPEVRVEMSSACRSVELLGNRLKNAAVDFLESPCSPVKRQDMVRVADTLLSGVTRMLYIADIADALRLQASLKRVDKKLADLDLSQNTNDLIRSFKRLGMDLLTVTNLTSDIEDMSDPERSIDLEAACVTLRKTGETLESAPKKYESHPPVLKEIRNDYYDVLQQVIGATDIISKVLNPNTDESLDVQSIISDIITHFIRAGNRNVDAGKPQAQIFKFSEALSNIDEKIDVCSCVYSDLAIRTEVQRSLNKIIKEAAVIADIGGVKEKTRSALLQACFKTTDSVRNSIAKHTDGDSDILDENEFQRQTIVGIAREATKELRKSVLTALLDHISAKYKGMEKLLSPGILLSDEENEKLHEYVEYMKEVSRLTAFLSVDDEMKSNVGSAVKRLSYIRREVVATSELLANSKKRLNTCKESWQSNVKTLRNAMQSISNEALSSNRNAALKSRDHYEAGRLTADHCYYGVNNSDDNYWWDNTTDNFTARSYSSSSADYPINNNSGSDQLWDNSEEGSTENSDYHGMITSRSEPNRGEPNRSAEFYAPSRHPHRRTLTPQPMTSRSLQRQQQRLLSTPQPIRRSVSQMSEPYSPHPRRRYNSISGERNQLVGGYESLQIAVSDMQVNIAPKLASVLSESATGSRADCSDENHVMIVDSLKLVYRGIQTICTALLDEKQFARPEFNAVSDHSDGPPSVMENGTEESEESSQLGTVVSDDDCYDDGDVDGMMGNGKSDGKLWNTVGKICFTSKSKSKQETSL